MTDTTETIRLENLVQEMTETIRELQARVEELEAENAVLHSAIDDTSGMIGLGYR